MEKKSIPQTLWSGYKQHLKRELESSPVRHIPVPQAAEQLSELDILRIRAAKRLKAAVSREPYSTRKHALNRLSRPLTEAECRSILGLGAK